MVHLPTALSVIVLILVANAAPVAAKYWLGRTGGRAIDAGLRLGDRQPLFGPNKTWRGIVAALFATSVASALFGLPAGLGLAIAGSAIAGDLLSSFLKRRLGLESGADAPALDLAAESLFPAILAKYGLGLSWLDVALIVAGFFLTHRLLALLWRRLAGAG